MNVLPKDIFPKDVERYIEQVSISSATNESFVSLGVLAANNILSSGSKLEVKEDYTILPNMYMCVVAQKGSAKSISLNSPLRYLVKKEHDLWAIYQKLREKYEARLNNAPAQAKASIREDEPKEPKTSIVSKATTEGLKERLGANEKGGYTPFALFKLDELNRFFGGLNQYKGGAGDDTEFYLEMYDGAYLNETFKSGRLIIENAHVSIVGSIQPKIFRDAFSGTNQSNGFFDRFLFAVDLRFPNMSDPCATMEKYANKKYMIHLEDVRKWRDSNGSIYKLNDHFRKKFHEFCLWTYEQGIKCNNGAFKKWETNAYKIILNLHVLWKREVIDDDIFDRGITLMKFFVKEWIIGYKLTEESEEYGVEKELIQWIKSSVSVTKREISQKAKYRTNKTKVDMVEKILSSLVERDLVTMKKDGRKVTYYWNTEKS